ncbi:unnamed protein product [Orchesella dallaii]|uniref:Uncharacterized protein n=1 Tax=Orchesella dallaii TaxID=48710 RepID=A0ABP1S122_9HEXA
MDEHKTEHMESSTSSCTNWMTAGYYLDEGVDTESVDELEIHQLEVKNRNGYSRAHHYYGEEIVPLNLDVVITELYVNGHLELEPNRLTSMLGNPEYGKRELSREKYPPIFIVESIILDLCMDDSNGKRTEQVLERIRLEQIAGLGLIVDGKCLDAIRALGKWLDVNGECIVSFSFAMYCSFRSCRMILPALLKMMPNLERLDIIPVYESISNDPILTYAPKYFGQGYITPKLKEINLPQSELANESFLYLMTLLDKGHLEKCGNFQNISPICEQVNEFYKSHFGITFIGVDECTKNIFVDTLHHYSKKKSIKFFLKFGHFPVNLAYPYI